MAIDQGKLFGLALATGWLAWCLHGEDSFGLVGTLIFLTHEGGHPLFAIFGRFMGSAGGTLMQFLVPLAFIGSFYIRGQVLSAAVCVHWLAASLFMSSAYAADAIAQELPLIHTGMTAAEELEAYGETGHDWINMLDMLHLNPNAAIAFSWLIWFAGCVAWAVAIVIGLRAAGVDVPLPAALRRWL